MPSEFAPSWGTPRVTKKQIKEMQENYKKAESLAKDTRALEAQEKATLDDVFAKEFEEVFTIEQQIWVYIGRFQPLHRGHEKILKQMIESNDKVLIFIGTGWIIEKNPFSFSECESFFSEYISWDFIVQELQDVPHNTMWINNLLEKINVHTTENVSINFYWWDLENDYAIKVVREYIAQKIPKKVEYIEVPRQDYTITVGWKEIAISGTICRWAIEHNDWDFLAKVVSTHVYNILQSKNI